MTDQPIELALASLIRYNQFYVARLEWLPAESKYKKTPCYPNGAVYIMDGSDPANWLDYHTACDHVDTLNARNDGYRYALAFYLLASNNLWFFDVDKCVNSAGILNEWGQWAWDNLPGVFVEWSSSGDGLHFVGRGNLPEHGCRFKAAGLELYTEKRSITFGLTGRAWGSIDCATATDTMASLIPQYFPPLDRNSADAQAGPRADWRGPIDDDDLIMRAMQSRSAASQFSGKASFSDLWQRNVAVLAISYPYPNSDVGYGESEADQALAAHLAFWTGCNAERIERLMRRSALMRDKWDTHGTYLRKLTIGYACANQKEVCKDKAVEHALPVNISEAEQAASSDWISRLVQADEAELRNVIIPAIAADRSIQLLDRDRLAGLLKDRFAVFQIPTTIGICRNMLKMQAIESDENSFAVPLFAQQHVYVLTHDNFFNVETASAISRTAFNAQFNRLMPMRGNGDREDATKWCLERWGTRTVDGVMYAPGREPIFNHAGKWHVNLFSPLSIPIAAPIYTVIGTNAIEKFLKLVWLMCDQREKIYSLMISWMAHNVQKPGTKIRFSPLIKGVEGDGKSIVVEVLRAAMGHRNVNSVGPGIVANTGGFTDFAHGFAVVALEEMMLTGKDRYRVHNILKEFITNSFISIHPKGGTPFSIINTTNYVSFTNHIDAIPISDTDRRWWIIFTPYSSCSELCEALELSGMSALSEYFTRIFESLDSQPGEWRKYFMEYAIDVDFIANGHAPFTDEKDLMRDSGEDEYEAIARQIISEGCEGVTDNLLSSSCLSLAMRAVAIMDGLDIPKTTAFNHLLTRLGFAQIGVVRWRGKTHRVWSKGGKKMDTDLIRDILELTKVPSYKHLRLVTTPCDPVSN